MALLTGCLACIALGVIAAGSSAAATGAQQFTIYSVATGEQYINNNDDEARGDVNNPFGVQTLGGPTLPKVENGNGPFAGDQTLFTFKLYTEPISRPMPVRRYSPANTISTRTPIAMRHISCARDAHRCRTFNFNATGFVLASPEVPRNTVARRVMSRRLRVLITVSASFSTPQERPRRILANITLYSVASASNSSTTKMIADEGKATTPSGTTTTMPRSR